MNGVPLDPREAKALRHIVANGDDRALQAKSRKLVKLSLWQRGFLRRRVGDWAWIPTDDGIKAARGAP